MGIKLYLAWFVFVLVFMPFLVFATDETLTITTYYPSPYGNYRQLSADQITIGSTYRNPTYADGNLYVQGNVGIGTTSPTSKLHVVGLPVYANNAAAIAGGLTAGALYRTGSDPDQVCVVH